MDYSKIGKHLKLLRERKGLNYDQIFEITRIQPSIIADIERGESKISPVFLRGFIKTYASVLGLSTKELFREMEKDVHLSQKEKQEQLSSTSKTRPKSHLELRWKGMLLAVLVIPLIWFFDFFYEKQDIKPKNEQALVKKVPIKKVDSMVSLSLPLKTKNMEILKSDSLKPDFLFDQIRNSVFTQEVLIQSSDVMKIYFKVDQQSTVTKSLKPLIWLSIKAKKSIYLRFDEKKGNITVFYNGKQVPVGNHSFFEMVFQ